MDRAIFQAGLQYENAWAFRVIRIVLYQPGIDQARYYLPHMDSIVGQFVITMFGDADYAFLDQPADLLQCFAHVGLPQFLELRRITSL